MRLLPKTPVIHNWEEKEQATLERASKRVAKLSEDSMLEWADNALSEIGECLYRYHHTHSDEWLSELRDGIITFQAVVQELAMRAQVDKLS